MKEEQWEALVKAVPKAIEFAKQYGEVDDEEMQAFVGDAFDLEEWAASSKARICKKPKKLKDKVLNQRRVIWLNNEGQLKRQAQREAENLAKKLAAAAKKVTDANAATTISGKKGAAKSRKAAATPKIAKKTNSAKGAAPSKAKIAQSVVSQPAPGNSMRRPEGAPLLRATPVPKAHNFLQTGLRALAGDAPSDY
eukprot:m.90957 g.90957  ORF g.90957 m.90957 type:complete len:195 (+) comp8482_c0_seq2:1282-1866(+)